AVTINGVVSLALGVAFGYFLYYCRRLLKVSGYIKAQA
ncbi:MAG: L-alanine exporter AlaE, partial [Hafnia sp.]